MRQSVKVGNLMNQSKEKDSGGGSISQNQVTFLNNNNVSGVGNNNNANSNTYRKNYKNSVIQNNPNTNKNNNQNNSNLPNSQTSLVQVLNNQVQSINHFNNRPAVLKISEFDEILNNALNCCKDKDFNMQPLHSPRNNGINNPTYSSFVENTQIQNSHQNTNPNPNPSPVNQITVPNILNTKTSNKPKIYESKKSEPLLNSNFLELYNYFLENNLNLAPFCEIFYNIDKTFSLGEKENINSYSVIVIKSNLVTKIKRNIIDKFENFEMTKSYLFILEGRPDEMDKFLADVFVFTEGFGNIDEISLVNMVTNRKLDELKEKFEIVSERIKTIGNEESLDDFGNPHTNPNSKNKNLKTSARSKFDNKIPNPNNNITAGTEKIKIIFFSVAARIMTDKNQKGIFIIYNIGDNETICEFIPVNNYYKTKHLKFNIKDIKALIKYRFLYQFKALNFLLYTKKRTKILDFETEENFQNIYQFLQNNSPKLDKNFTDIKFHTNLWVDGLMSNYDYLMYLNIMGGRSFTDLGQYPIMPWVITNYEDEENLDLNDVKNFRDLSKPIGALNAKRMKTLRDNYNELKEQGRDFPFLYGTFYSFPYIVFYYLMRTHSLFFLRFQGGNFGPCDRLFYSIKECWNSSYKNPGSQDVKELIPEFYNTDGEFLKNINFLEFGKTQNDEVVGDVILPKWAKSGKDFISIMRAALESEIVSSNLHQWIDLVFGFKQRGEKAFEAENLFHHLRYDDKYNLTLEPDKSDEERQGEIDNIFEFGQVPIQLFLNEPHPKKRSKFSIKEISYDSDSNNGEFFVKVSRLKKERMNMEKKYEKERRQKENEVEDVQKKLEDKEKEFGDQVREIDKTIREKETEFAAYLSTLMDQNSQLKKNFQDYDQNKDLVYQKWIHDVKMKHYKELESMFADKMNLFKYFRDLENLENNFKGNERVLNKKSQEISNNIEQSQNAEKKLREELFIFQKIIRILPPDQQIYLNRKVINNDAHENEINIKKMIKDIK